MISMTTRAQRVAAIIGAVGLFVTATLLWNYLSLQAAFNKAVESDHRNAAIEVRTHYGSYVNPSVLVFDVRSIDGEKSPTDVFRLLLQFASEVQDKEFQVVQLAHQGRTKFLLDGVYFRQLGSEYGTQNPVYTMRTLPENLLRPNGDQAYQRWEGGWLGVTTKQLEDFSDFHEQWYLLDLAKKE